MEQVTEQTINFSSLSWMQSKYRSLLMNYLQSIELGCIKVHEGSEEQVFGDATSHLQASLVIESPDFYNKVVRGGGIGLAESYIDGDWQTSDLVALLRIFAINQSQSDQFEKIMSVVNKVKNKLFHFFNRNSQAQAKKNILSHYDLGDELYTRFLDTEMVYSSAVFENQEQSLEQAQLNKFKSICDALELQATDHLVEIGTGWGGLAIYAAQHYGCKVTTTTISDKQHDYAKNRIEQLGLTEQITLLKKDYRLLTGQYDKLVSVEMIEAVGKEYFHEFFSKCDQLVKPKGKMLIQAITIADQRYASYSNNVDFIQRYIFPGGCLPSITQIQQNLTKHTNMVTQSIRDIGLDYALTLQHWTKRFLANWQEIKPHGYDENFKRLWLFYFAYCEAAFLEKKVSTVHVLADKLD
jgi:cyclopropane-fatty-acyl-phospholipid synthase